MSPSLELPELNQTESMKEFKEKIMFVLEDENILDKKRELADMGIKDNEAQNILEHVGIIKYHESKMQETSVNKEDYNAHKDARDINALILEEAIEKECKIKSYRKKSFDSLDGFTDTESASFPAISRKNSFDSLDGFTDTESVYSSRSLTPNFIDSVISDMVQESKEKISDIIENYSQDNHDNSYQSLIDHGINKKEANILISEIKNVKFAQKNC